jgi:hypothetical protein
VRGAREHQCAAGPRRLEEEGQVDRLLHTQENDQGGEANEEDTGQGGAAIEDDAVQIPRAPPPDMENYLCYFDWHSKIHGRLVLF